MGNIIPIDLKVIKPKFCSECMCVYKFTLDNGFYYYGATSDLLDRIHTHLKRYRNKKMSLRFREAFKSAKQIVFEVVKFANNREKLKKYEEYFLERNVGLQFCLNNVDYSTSTYERYKSIYPIIKLDLNGNVLKRYDSPTLAAIDLKKSLKLIRNSLMIKYPKTKYVLRRLDENGNIAIPFKPFREYPSQRKPIIQYDKEMNFIANYISTEDAGRKTGFDRKGISLVAKGKQKLCHGYIFKYETDLT